MNPIAIGILLALFIGGGYLCYYMLKQIKVARKEKEGIPKEILVQFEYCEKEVLNNNGSENERSPYTILWNSRKQKPNSIGDGRIDNQSGQTESGIAVTTSVEQHVGRQDIQNVPITGTEQNISSSQSVEPTDKGNFFTKLFRRS